ncbi:MAG: hypothetical protein IJ759_05420 [Bacteroidales bacterium]|nr:hypothetical protein [Bacteroidales bacterium]
MKYQNASTEEFLKRDICKDWFNNFETNILPEKGNRIDCCISIKDSINSIFGLQSLLWAEAKIGNKENIFESFVQIVLTVGKERTFDWNLPPKYLGAFDGEKIAFVPYGDIMKVFYINDFNWNTTPSDHESKEFQKMYDLLKNEYKITLQIFDYIENGKELKKFISKNFNTIDKTSKIQVNTDNFVYIYSLWRKKVKPHLNIDWEEAAKENIQDAAFFIADLISKDNVSLYDKYAVELKKDKYILGKKKNKIGLFSADTLYMDDKAIEKHSEFWSIYERPPKYIYQKIILERYDLLVPQDFRQRKGAFYTPRIWVEKSQQYLANYLGENWQEEYYIWDCAAGTGNLLNGLKNKYRIFASTLDQADVSAMHVQIERDGDKARLLKEHVFQFDFLNNDFFDGKLPQDLVDILQDDEKRKRLIIYINPPYAEATTTKTITGTGGNKTKVATDNKTWAKYRKEIGKASNELFCQILIRIYREIPSSTIANFSTLKNLQSSNFVDFRRVFQPKLEKLFIVPAKSFDNVEGSFPIGFFIWNTQKKEQFTSIDADVFDINGSFIQKKTINNNYISDSKSLNDWFKRYKAKDNKDKLGLISSYPADYQNNNKFSILTTAQARYCNVINKDNFIYWCVYFSVRLCIEATWINDREQFFTPFSDDYFQDTEFLNDCLTFTLFNSQNRITCNNDNSEINHWIPFKENEVDAKGLFRSNFMTDYIQGKIKPTETAKDGDLFAQNVNDIKESKDINGIKENKPLVFSSQAQEVFDAGRLLWRYYHQTAGADENKDRYNVNASYYDIREFFQGRDSKSGRMNNKSSDLKYMDLVGNLRMKEKELGDKIAKKVYQYGFLR